MKILLFLLLFFNCTSAQQDLDFMINKVDDEAYFLSERSGSYLLTNTCDTIIVPVSNFTGTENLVLNQVSIEQRDLRREFGRVINSLLQRAGLAVTPTRLPNSFTTRFIVDKNRALAGAASGILGLDSTFIETSRLKLDSTQIVYYTRDIPLPDTTLLRSQLDAGNISFATYFETSEDKLDTLRNFLNDPVNGWTSEEIP